MNLGVRVHLEVLESGRLSAKITTSLGDVQGDISYFFYLLRYGRVIHRSDWVRRDHYEFDLDESGVYSVQGHARYRGKNVSDKSTQMFVMTPSDEIKYREWRSGSTKAFPLKFYSARYPFSDILIDIGGRGQAATLEDLGLIGRRSWEGRRELIFSRAAPRAVSGGELYYSGIAKTNESKSLLVGYNDIVANTDLDRAIGSWTAIKTSPNRIDILSDIGGVCRWYRLKTESEDILANSYHLLLIYAARRGVQLRLNDQHVLASLAFTGLQPLHQLYSKYLPVDGAEMVLPDRHLQVGLNGEVIEQLTILRSALDFTPSSEAEVQNLKRSAAADIFNNVDIVLSDPRFTSVLCDLSGGLDSRSVYSAVTAASQATFSKAIVHARESSREPLDHVVACKLNSFYGLPYDDLYTDVIPNSAKSPWEDHWSYYLGTYFSYRPALMKKRHRDGVVRLVGFYGEVCFRDYYSRSLRGGDLDVDCPKEFAHKYLRRNSAASLIAAPGLAEVAMDTLSEALESIPGRRALDKFENHYIYYRNGLHCSPVLRSDYSALEWGPLQSISALMVKSSNICSGIDFQLEVIEKLNPLLARVPYQDEADEQRRANFSVATNSWLDNIDMALDVGLDPWREAVQRKKEREVRPQMTSEFYQAVREDKQRFFERSLEALRFVLTAQGESFEPVAKSAWYILSSSASKSYGGQEVGVANRIVSLAAQLDIISRS